jgi:phosphonate transport system substrate-binding protein
MQAKRMITPVSIMLLVLLTNMAIAADKVYTFGVLNQRNPVLTAEYWNSILDYVSKKSGVALQLKMGKTVQETDSMTEGGEFDFLFSNHIFIPRISKAGYQVIARPIEESIKGQIVVMDYAPIRMLEDLEGKEVAFPSEMAFVAYAVTMDALMQKGIQVKTVLAGNQEGAMGQLKAGRVSAASVNSQVMREFANREHFKYRVLWSSAKFAGMPIAVNRRVNKKAMRAVRDAFVGMASDPEGLKVLAASAAVIKQKPPFGFVAADERDYENQREFYKKTLLKGF